MFDELRDEYSVTGNAQEDSYAASERAPALVNLMCESRGDLFVWSEAKSALLTTNLKRIKASIDPKHGSAAELIPVFQVLLLTSPPVNPLVELIPDPIGESVALRNTKELCVVLLKRQRGEYGEFGGGQKRVNCKVALVAKELLTIHAQSLELLQASWHPEKPHCICLLTSDNTMRMFGLLEPDLPILTICLSGSTLSQSLRVQDTFIAFQFWANSVFVLQDNGDIWLCQFREGATLKPPLSIRPPSEDNYGSDPASILVLSMRTIELCVVVIANSSGVLHHCILSPKERVDDGREETEEEEEEGALYVVESIKLEDTMDEDCSLTLVADPVDPYRYFVRHSNGLYMVTLPWLENMVNAASQPIQVVPQANVRIIVSTPPPTRLQGVVIVNQDLLRDAIIATSTDGECLAAPLRSEQLAPMGGASSYSQGSGVHAEQLSSRFLEHVQRVLIEGRKPLPRRFALKKDESQESCLRYLYEAVQTLRQEYLLREHKAMKEMEHRISVLVEQKAQQISDLLALEEEREAIEEKSRELEDKLSITTDQCSGLVESLERLVCKLHSQSPVLSIAECNMADELRKKSDQLKALESSLQQARQKVHLGYGRAAGEGKVLTPQQYKHICAALSESGKDLKNLVQKVKALTATIQSAP